MKYSEAIRPPSSSWELIREVIVAPQSVAYQYKSENYVLTTSIDMLHEKNYYHITLFAENSDANLMANEAVALILRTLVPESKLSDWDESMSINPLTRSFWYLIDPYARVIRSKNIHTQINNVIPFVRRVAELKR